jgi:MAF protein
MLILASSSPYRKSLLSQLSLKFETIAPQINEHKKDGESPDDLVLRLSLAKASAIIAKSDDVIIASDQVAVVDGKILSKPHNFENAKKQLQMMAGKRVDFLTSLCVKGEQTQNIVEKFSVFLRDLTESEITKYLQLEKPYDCAGSFKAEGLGISLFSKMSGDDPNTLIGLPLIKLIAMLKVEGIHIL